MINFQVAQMSCSIHCTGRWVDHSVILGIMAKRHLLSLSGVGFLLFVNMFHRPPRCPRTVTWKPTGTGVRMYLVAVDWACCYVRMRIRCHLDLWDVEYTYRRDGSWIGSRFLRNNETRQIIVFLFLAFLCPSFRRYEITDFAKAERGLLLNIPWRMAYVPRTLNGCDWLYCLTSILRSDINVSDLSVPTKHNSPLSVVFTVVVIVLWAPTYGWRKVWAWAPYSSLLHGVSTSSSVILSLCNCAVWTEGVAQWPHWGHYSWCIQWQCVKLKRLRNVERDV